MLLMILDTVDNPDDRIKVEKLYRKYDRLMYYIAGRILKRHEDIEDAVMEAWIRIIRNINKISEISCPETKSFLVIIVERVSIDVYNKNKKISSGELPIEDFEESPFFSVKDDAFERMEIYEVINRLSKKYSDVLILYYMHDMTVKEISKLLNISEDAVNKRLQRGRKLLREGIENGR